VDWVLARLGLEIDNLRSQLATVRGADEELETDGAQLPDDEIVVQERSGPT
jgi:hypothetical protein